jgi:hypothetical protein
MTTAIFIVPFPSEIPAPEWVHKCRELNGTILIEARADDAVIEAMKADPAYCWLEDKTPAAPLDGTPEKPVEEPSKPVEGKLPTELTEATTVASADPVVVKEWVVSLKTDARITEASKDGKIIKPTEITAIGVAVQAEVDEMAWDTPEDAIASVVRLHGQTMEGYKGSGLG